MTRILLTGASGGIGQNLITGLARPDRQFDALVRPVTDRSMLTRLGVQQFLEWERLYDCDLAVYDCVIHAAAIVHRDSQGTEQKDLHYAVNRDLTRGLALACQQAHIPHLIFLSTSAVFGRHQTGVLTLDHHPEPDDPYGLSKRAAERDLENIFDSRACTILRLPMVYGPQIKGNFHKLMTYAAKGWRMPLGSTKSKRSFLYIGNLITAMDRLIAGDVCSRAGCKYYFITDQEDLTSADLYELAYRRFNHGRNAVYPTPPLLLSWLSRCGSVLERLTRRTMPFNRSVYSRLFDENRYDSTAFSEDTGWTPTFTPEQGVAATCDWFMREQEGL